MAEQDRSHAEAVGSVLADLCALGGAGLVAYGAWMIYAPAGFIAGGSAMLALGVIGIMRRGR